MSIEKETRELFMRLPTWNTRDALRMLLEIDPDSIRLEDDFDGTEIEIEARALISWLYRFGLLPRDFDTPTDAEPEAINTYLDAIGEIRLAPAQWIAAAAANRGAPTEWLETMQSTSGTPENREQPNVGNENPKQYRQRLLIRHRELVKSGNKAPTKALAAEEKITDSRARALLRDARKNETKKAKGDLGLLGQLTAGNHKRR